MKSAFYISLSFEGALPSNEDLVALLGSELHIRHHGDDLRAGTPAPQTVGWMVLAEWEAQASAEYQRGHAQLEQATHVLRQLTPAILSLNQDHISAYIRIDIAVSAWQGAFDLPAHFVQAAGEAGLSLYVSWLLDFDDDE